MEEKLKDLLKNVSTIIKKNFQTTVNRTTLTTGGPDLKNDTLPKIFVKLKKSFRFD